MVETRNLTYMFYGFAAAFLILLVYVMSLAGRERKLRGELDRVRRMIEIPSKEPTKRV
jgi:CcmD family protein